MTPTTHAILNSVATSDPNLSLGEKSLLHRLISGQAAEGVPSAPNDAPLLLNQKQAARALGVSRVTLWRMTKSAVFHPVEIFPGSFRYRREEVEAVAREGHLANSRRKVARQRQTT